MGIKVKLTVDNPLGETGIFWLRGTHLGRSTFTSTMWWESEESNATIFASVDIACRWIKMLYGSKGLAQPLVSCFTLVPVLLRRSEDAK